MNQLLILDLKTHKIVGIELHPLVCAKAITLLALMTHRKHGSTGCAILLQSVSALPLGTPGTTHVTLIYIWDPRMSHPRENGLHFSTRIFLQKPSNGHSCIICWLSNFSHADLTRTPCPLKHRRLVSLQVLQPAVSPPYLAIATFEKYFQSGLPGRDTHGRYEYCG